MWSVVHELGMEVLAGHVASGEDLATVQRLGCDLCQGHSLGHPIDAEQL